MHRLTNNGCQNVVLANHLAVVIVVVVGGIGGVPLAVVVVADAR